jgi:two-component system CheB/CheR fusion protein
MAPAAKEETDRLAYLAMASRIAIHLERARRGGLARYGALNIARAARQRMAEMGVRSVSEYLVFLDVTPGEISRLVRSLLVPVTSFFRDPSMWAALAWLVERRSQEVPETRMLRFWSAGSATGEEAYSLAMLCADVFGQAGAVRRVRIFGTDVDRTSVEIARRGIFPARALQAVPSTLRQRYFERRARDGSFRFHPDLRRMLVFGEHDLLVDPPLSRIDVVLCRNVLLYLDPRARAYVLERFHFALDRAGLLVVGERELLGESPPTFRVVDRVNRIFTPATVARSMLGGGGDEVRRYLVVM